MKKYILFSLLLCVLAFTTPLVPFNFQNTAHAQEDDDLEAEVEASESEEVAEEDDDDEEDDFVEEDDEEDVAESSEDGDSEVSENTEDQEDVADAEDAGEFQDEEEFEETEDDVEEIADEESDESEGDDDFKEFDDEGEEVAEGEGGSEEDTEAVADKTEESIEDEEEGELALDPLEDDAQEESEIADEDIAPAEPAKPEVTEESFDQPSQEESIVAESGGDTDPDLDYETYLHNIYMKFHSQATSEEEWNQAVADRLNEVYAIEPGDSLWAISKVLFGDGNYWPKVWSVNGNISNPHLIKEGNQLNFILGNEDDAPAFSVTETQQVEEEVETLPVTKNEALPDSQSPVDSEVEIPPPLKESRPVLARFPPSLPLWQLTQNEQNKYDNMGIDFGKRGILNVKDEVPLSSYVLEDPVKGVGEVVEIEDGNRIASDYQYIYVSMKPNVASIGESYLVLFNRGKILPAIKGMAEADGYAIDVQGEVQLVEKVKANISGDVFRALVKKSVNPVAIGGRLVVGKIEKVPVTDRGTKKNVVAQIIGGSFSNRRRVFNTESLAFLNRGSKDGLSKGDVLPVRANQSLRNSKSVIQSSVRPIGWLKVVKVSEKVSTAVVAKSWSDIQAGDYTGAGELRSRRSAKSNILMDEDESGQLGDEFGDDDAGAAADDFESSDDEDFEDDLSDL